MPRKPPRPSSPVTEALDPEKETAVEHDIDIEDELTAEHPVDSEEEELLLDSDPEPPTATPAAEEAERLAPPTPTAEELDDDDIAEELDDAALEEIEPGSPPGIPALRDDPRRPDAGAAEDGRGEPSAAPNAAKRRVRNTVRIPDDAVPAATPAPPPTAKAVESPDKEVEPATTRRADPADASEPAGEAMTAPVATLPPPPRPASNAAERAAPLPPTVAAGSGAARELPPQRTRSGTVVMKPEQGAPVDAEPPERLEPPVAPAAKTVPEAGRADDLDWSPAAPPLEPTAPSREAPDAAAAPAAETPSSTVAQAERAPTTADELAPEPAAEPAVEEARREPSPAPDDARDAAANDKPEALPLEPPTLPLGTKVPRITGDDGAAVIEPMMSRPPIPRPGDSSERAVRSRRPIGAAADGPTNSRAPSSARPSTPSGVVADQQAVGLILPVFVSSDLPPVESQRGRKVAPPRRLSREDEAFDGIEEIEPEAEITVPDGKIPEDTAADTPSPTPADAAGAAGRRAPPPRRPRPDDASGIEVDLDLEDELADRTPTPRPPAATPSPVAAVPPPPPVPPPPVFEATPAEVAAEAEAPVPAAEPKPSGTPAPKAPKRKKPWWSELFEEDYVKTHDSPVDKDIAREADFIERVLNLAKGARVLDLGCGLGRHAVELAKRGYEMVGVDHSTLMLAKANEHAAERGMGVNFVKGDMRKLSLDAVFDGIYCWSQTFGYFDEQTNHGVLESIHRALRPGGTFALDVANRDFVAPRSPTMVWFERPGCVCMDEMKFDFYTSRMIVKRTVLFETGRSREIEYSMRMYSLHELGRMLHGCGFRVLEVSGHRAHPGTYFGSESPRIIVAAERV